ncbi:hypothetical protein K502DRAFT_338222 [Neoconidiobolus thromboides FSU 785]|nr:hypothetical protein K502DRAFT_338222 [Neoconidiobolus thromboides FSU 785]
MSKYNDYDVVERGTPIDSNPVSSRTSFYSEELTSSVKSLRRSEDSDEYGLPNSSAFSSFLNMTNSIIGAGIIGLPFSMRQSGMFVGLILLAVLTWVADWTINLLVHNAKLSGTKSYQELAHFCFGKFGLILISVSQFVFAFGGMCAYTVIIGDTIPAVILALFPSIKDHPTLYLLGNRKFMIALLTIGISYPLSLLRDISKLAKASFFALVAMFIIVVAVLVEGPYVPEELKGSPSLNWNFFNKGMFQGVAVIAFALVCHHNSFVIFADLEKPTMDRFAMITHLSTGVSMFFCAIMATAGYVAFTDKTEGNILNNFPADNTFINIARFCFGLNMFSTFPLEHYVAREVIENYYYPNDITPFKSFLATTVLVGISLLIALVTCDLGFVMEITGGLSASVLAFILPAACYLKLSPLRLFSMKHIPHLLCLSFGLLTMTLSTILSLNNFFDPNRPSSQC